MSPGRGMCILAQLGDEPPAMPSSVKSQIVTRSTDEDAARIVGEQAWSQYEAALDRWQRVNTAIYWHVMPSLWLAHQVRTP